MWIYILYIYINIHIYIHIYICIYMYTDLHIQLDRVIFCATHVSCATLSCSICTLWGEAP